MVNISEKEIVSILFFLAGVIITYEIGGSKATVATLILVIMGILSVNAGNIKSLMS